MTAFYSPFFKKERIMDFLPHLQILWDYLNLHREPQKAQCIVGFGSFDDSVARRAGELYLQGFAPKILFTGGLGRCTDGLFTEPEAVRFGKVAMEMGVPPQDILLEDRSANTKENILFTRALLENTNTPHNTILGVHKPYMERRIAAAMGVYWPEQSFAVTSPQMDIGQYLAGADRQGLSRKEAISVIVGDFQRIDVYAHLGYQLPQQIPDRCWEAYRVLVAMGYDSQLVK